MKQNFWPWNYMLKGLKSKVSMALKLMFLYLSVYFTKGAEKRKQLHVYVMWPPFSIKTAPVLFSILVHIFSRYVVPRILENSPQLLCGFMMPQCLMSLHIIPDWLHDVDIRAPVGPYHLLHSSLFLLSLKVVLYDSGFIGHILLQNIAHGDCSMWWIRIQTSEVL